MTYKLIIAEHAEELLDEIIYHLIFHFKSSQAAAHLLDSLEQIYFRLEDNPFQFPPSRDPYLNNRHYREALLSDMSYLVLFRVEGKNVFISGIFHQAENYGEKLF
ncbi:MAG TPA: type II toxin-antitoxin system RelE/ParE family toxin [Candidatus Eisenbergiella merdavium]|uniref:Type II toxin-antitoxin system RelE/ParE family toxin n=1 Tax=Candidatus Eisenbergiella merdavium TaxID=2838551 RepID=A0A9D2NEK7_9FIRM|nr:type II toxin-antitoxin system RelE/ParE family toxin [Candidatus Eisenbergiella merdavium]